MNRERKELACGSTRREAISRLNDMRTAEWIDGKLEAVQDSATRLWSIYRKRVPTDRTIKRPVTREARTPYIHGYGRDRRPVIVTLLPREMIETRLKGTRRRYQISWDDLHRYLVRRHALQAMAAHQREKAARRKQRRKGHKQ